MSGVSADAVTARDFIMVRAKLVREVGGANEALVWARVFFRVGGDSAIAYEQDGERWWAATHEALAEETGLTVKQVRTAIEALVKGEFLVREHHAGYDRTSSYRPLVHLPSGADGTAQNGTFQLPIRADVPLIDLEDISRAQPRKKPEVRIPRSWAPTAAHIDRAKASGVDVLAEAERFRLHAETHDRHAANWNAAFTTWLMKARPTAVADNDPETEWMRARG